MGIGHWALVLSEVEVLGIGYSPSSPSSPTLREAKATSTPVFFFNFEF
ncbi:hypothetical protein [Nostoc sp.]